MRMTKGEDAEDEGHEQDERVQVAPSMEARASQPQATTGPEEEERQRKKGQHSEEKEEILRFLRECWSD